MKEPFKVESTEMFENLDNTARPSTTQWLFTSVVLMLGVLVSGLILIMLLNGSLINHLLTPVLQYTSLFKILWQENVIGAMQFLLNKSLLTFAHQDPKSGLNVWTFEFDSYTTAVYIVASLVAGKVVAQHRFNKYTTTGNTLAFTLTGLCLLVLSMSYMTQIDHCSGATWVGFVGLYGLGLDEFQLYPVYQIIIGITGLGLLATGFYKSRKPSKLL